MSDIAAADRTVKMVRASETEQSAGAESPAGTNPADGKAENGKDVPVQGKESSGPRRVKNYGIPIMATMQGNISEGTGDNLPHGGAGCCFGQPVLWPDKKL